MKKIYINSAGCNENLLDGEILRDTAQKSSFLLVEDPKDANLIVYNTCAFKKEQEDATIKAIKRLQRIKKKDAELIVCGCIVKINNERLRRFFKGQTFSPYELTKFPDILNVAGAKPMAEANCISEESFSTQIFKRPLLDKVYAVKAWSRRTLGVNLLPEFNILDFLGDKSAFFLRIARGCINSCTYCAVRFAQGPLISMPLEIVLAKVSQGVLGGHQHIFLSATNISAYGKDIGENFLNTLKQITQIKGDYRITVHNLEPCGIIEEPQKFLETLSSPKISAIYCPINSGSQRVLNYMKRKYEINNWMGILEALRRNNPRLLIRTEFIVGFPGENWKDFYATLLLIARFKFDLIDLHYYSPRPNTEALLLNNQNHCVIKRLRYLIALLVIFFRVWLPKLKPI